MAGVSGSQAWLGVAKQTAKGTPATAPAFVNPFTGGNAQPDRVVERLQETDNNRDPGSSYLVRGGTSGAPELYVRPESFPAYAAAALGKRTTTGASAPYTHALDTSVGTLPYISFFKQLGNILFERYEDCLVNSITVRAEAGQPLTAVVNFLGLSVTRSAAVWGSTPAQDTDEPWYYHEGTVTLGGAATANVRSFEITVENNVTQQQTDSIALYDVVAGRRDLTFSFDMIFDTVDAFNAYKTFHYGSTSGTTQATSLVTTSVNFAFAKGADTISFDIPSAAYEEFPAEPDAGGDPVIASVRGGAVRSGSPLTTWTVINGTTGTTYPA